MNEYEKVFEIGVSAYGERISIFKCGLCSCLVEDSNLYDHDMWHSELAGKVI